MVKKFVFLSILAASTNAFSIDLIKTCEIASKFVTPIYSVNYDYYQNLFSRTSPNSKERIKGGQIIDESLEKILDDVSAKISSLEPSEKFAVMSVYNFSVSYMNLQAIKDVSDDKNKQPAERIERAIFSKCVSNSR